LVHLSSERLVEPVRQDSSFTEKQVSDQTHLLVVRSTRAAEPGSVARSSGESAREARCRPLGSVGLPSRSPGPGGLRCPGHARRDRVTATAQA
jgi:hypothetical protein